MDESLQQIFRIRPLQESVNAYRNVSSHYAKIMKESYVSEMKNLINVEMDIEATRLEMPNAAKIPPISEQPIYSNDTITNLLCDYENTKNAFNLMK